MKKFKNKILGIYHIGCVGSFYHVIVEEQITELHNSGLYNKMNKMVIFISNYQECPLIKMLNLFDPKDKFVIVVSSKNLKEKFAIDGMRNYIDDETLVFYFHTKAVTRHEDSFHQWRKILNLYTLNKWRLSKNLLKEYDVVGCFLSRYPTYHYSGNFWWSRVSYLRKLPRCGNLYLSPEMWIGQLYESHKFISLTNKVQTKLKEHLPPHKKNIKKDITSELIENSWCKNLKF